MISRFAATQTVFQWHEDGISLPDGAVHLAASSTSPVQAFRYGEHAYGFQFHLEVDASLVERWLTVPDNQPLLAEEAGRVDPQRIREQTARRIGALQDLSRATFSRWIDRFDIAPRRRPLPSR